MTVEFEFEVKFDSGTVAGDSTSPQDLIKLVRLVEAKALGMREPTVHLDGATRTVGQIRSIDIQARW